MKASKQGPRDHSRQTAARQVGMSPTGEGEGPPPDGRYTVYTDCLVCGDGLAGKRPQAVFCSNRCRFNYHNARRRKQRPPAVGPNTAGHTERDGYHLTIAQGESKFNRVLAALASGRTLNRLGAEHDLGDHVLPSTISEIQRRLGIRVSRRLENRLARYWLDPGERKKAALIGKAPSSFDHWRRQQHEKIAP